MSDLMFAVFIKMDTLALLSHRGFYPNMCEESVNIPIIVNMVKNLVTYFIC